MQVVRLKIISFPCCGIIPLIIVCQWSLSYLVSQVVRLAANILESCLQVYKEWWIWSVCKLCLCMTSWIDFCIYFINFSSVSCEQWMQAVSLKGMQLFSLIVYLLEIWSVTLRYVHEESDITLSVSLGCKSEGWAWPQFPCECEFYRHERGILPLHFSFWRN